MITVFENTIPLRDLPAGKYAISQDRKQVWVAGYKYIKEDNSAENIKTILLLNNPADQYSDQWNMNQRVIVLKEGDIIQWKI